MLVSSAMGPMSEEGVERVGPDIIIPNFGPPLFDIFNKEVSSFKKYVAEIPIIPDSKSEFPECWDFKQVDISYLI